MNKLLLFLTLLADFSIACELTEEYRDARAEIANNARYAYEECRSSVSNYRYWLEVAQCEEDGRGENVEGRCQHLVANTPPGIEIDDSHCSVLEVGTEDMKKALAEYVEYTNMAKCSTTQPSGAGPPANSGRCAQCDE